MSLSWNEACALLDYAGLRHLGGGQAAALMISKTTPRLESFGLVMRVGGMTITERGRELASRIDKDSVNWLDRSVRFPAA